MEFKTITYQEAIDFLMPRHYSGRKPPVSIAFGWFQGERLVAVCTFGKPASNSLCRGVCGDRFKDHVYELNRLCRVDDLDSQLSEFVGLCLREIKSKDWIVVSYADTAMNHHGFIYQATNWIYTGATKSRTDKWVEGNKHSRHYSNENQSGRRKVRSSKHRYIFFCTKNKKLKKLWMSSLNYPVEPYPKGQNDNYALGEFLTAKTIVKKN